MGGLQSSRAGFTISCRPALPGQSASAVIFTAGYGEAEAVNELGPETGLPTAVSGQSSEWW